MFPDADVHPSYVDYAPSERNLPFCPSLPLALDRRSNPADGTACLVMPSQQVLGVVGCRASFLPVVASGVH